MPVILLVDVVGNVGAVAPAHIVNEFPKLNVGVTILFTVTENVVELAQSPDVGVKVYTPEFWLSTVDGLHAPVILLVDVGSVGTVPPVQMESEVPNVNAGVMFGLTVTLNVADVAHCPASGVKV